MKKQGDESASTSTFPFTVIGKTKNFNGGGIRSKLKLEARKLKGEGEVGPPGSIHDQDQVISIDDSSEDDRPKREEVVLKTRLPLPAHGIIDVDIDVDSDSDTDTGALGTRSISSQKRKFKAINSTPPPYGYNNSTNNTSTSTSAPGTLNSKVIKLKDPLNFLPSQRQRQRQRQRALWPDRFPCAIPKLSIWTWILPIVTLITDVSDSGPDFSSTYRSFTSLAHRPHAFNDPPLHSPCETESPHQLDFNSGYSNLILTPFAM